MKKFNTKLSLKAEADLFKKLAIYLSANLSLSETLQILEGQTRIKKISQALTGWRLAIESGKTLGQAFAISDGLKISSIGLQAAVLGERSGSLADAIKGASAQMDKTLTLRKKVAGAVAYPATILVASACLLIGLLVFVFPKIIPLFDSLKVKLPLSTRFLIGLSEGLSKYWFIGLVVLILTVVVGVLVVKFSEKGRVFYERLVVRIPILGGIIRLKIICHIFDSLATLLNGGEQLSVALQSVAESVRSHEYQEFLLSASEEVTQGRYFSDYLKNFDKLFPMYIIGILTAGERTSNVAGSMLDAANVAREELDDRLKVITAALEPLLMVTMSFIIGFIALSIILPIYGITSHLQAA